MKKTTTILGLMTALGLLFMAACEQGISPTAPDLGDFHDVRTNSAYTNNALSANGGSVNNYFPDISAPGLNGGRTAAADKNGYVEIDFTAAVAQARNDKKTLDILNGDAAANIKAAIVFEGVVHVSNANIPATDVAGAPPYNTYGTLTYTVTAVDRAKAYIELPDLAAYHAVRAHIKASAYKISGNPIDTDGNLAGGESPYDDYYGNGGNYLFVITDGADTANTTDRPTQPGPFSFSGAAGMSYETATAIYYVTYSDFDYDKADYSGLKDYFKLEKWNAGSKTWVDSGITGQYAITGLHAGNFYFSIPYAADTYDRYRIVAVDLYKFETSGAVRGFKRRFSTYPGIAGETVLAKNGRKVLDDRIFIIGFTYGATHLTSSTTLFTIPPGLYTDEQGKNAMLVFDVDTTDTGNLGFKDFPADINGNFKLAYNAGTVECPFYKYIPIARAVVRVKPGTTADAGTGAIEQQLVFTLDPGYTWTDISGKTIEIYAREGIGFAGDSSLVINGKPAGSLGDKNGTINIDGHYDWGSYGSFTLH
jgi:hypothetical protein